MHQLPSELGRCRLYFSTLLYILLCKRFLVKLKYPYGFRWRVGSWEPPGKLQNSTNDHRLLIVAAVVWPKYCRYGVKPHIINKSMLKSIYFSWFALKKYFLDNNYCYIFFCDNYLSMVQETHLVISRMLSQLFWLDRIQLVFDILQK